MTENAESLLRRLGEIEKQRGALLSQLVRQVAFHRKHGIQPHEIRTITLVPAGIRNRSRIEMRSGEVHLVEGNAKVELDGEAK